MPIRPILIDHSSIILDKKYTYFSSDLSSGQSSLTSDSIVGFAINQILLLGSLTQEKSEIILTHSSSSPSGSTITLSSNTSFSHSRGDKITLLDYNQIEISWSSTTTGSKTVLDTVSIQVDQQKSIYNDSVETSGYYFYRFKNSVDSSFSNYSDPIPYAGFGDDTVFSIKDRALKGLGFQLDDKITDDYLNKSLWEGRREIDNEVIRWSFRKKLDYNAGQIYSGTWRIPVPVDLRDPTGPNNILSIRIGKKNIPIDYQDIVRFNQNFRDIAHTTLNGAITSADLTVTLTKSGNFDESGNIYIAAKDSTETLNTVAYTSNAEDTNILSGVTGIQAAGHPDGTDVWQGVAFGLPLYFTIKEGYIYFSNPFDDTLSGEYILMDYYSTIPAYDSDADVLDEPDYDLYVSWLRWKIKYRKANGQIDPTKDMDYLEYSKRKKDLVGGELLGQTIYLTPDI